MLPVAYGGGGAGGDGQGGGRARVRPRAGVAGFAEQVQRPGTPGRGGGGVLEQDRVLRGRVGRV